MTPSISAAPGARALVRRAWRGTLCCAAASAALIGCSPGHLPTPEAMNRSYEEALLRTAPLAVELPAGEATTRTFARLEQFFAAPTPEAIQAQAVEVYAPAAYLNDNLAVVDGAAAIGRYFGHTARRVRSMKVQILDVMHQGPDYYARWRMTIDSPKLAGHPLVSYGITHFRFDAASRVLVHKDFWDSGTGLYEYLPVLGSLVRRVRAAAEPD
jgi:predicted SnoaL-like aldol condensation-catalyzing enzyme